MDQTLLSRAAVFLALPGVLVTVRLPAQPRPLLGVIVVDRIQPPTPD
jgi:hypothetical protein